MDALADDQDQRDHARPDADLERGQRRIGGAQIPAAAKRRPERDVDREERCSDEAEARGRQQADRAAEAEDHETERIGRRGAQEALQAQRLLGCF
ncbi:MAG: hypothetical protein ABI156_00615 [Caldimonas sp.]